VRNIRDTMRAEVEAIREVSGDTVALADVGSIVEGLLATLQGDISATTAEELKELIRCIENVKTEMAVIQPESIHGEHIPTATGQLDAALASTAEAADTILEAAGKEIETLADEVPEDLPNKLREVSTKIFKASSFQDLNGQPISKVTKSVQETEVKVISLLRAFGYLDSVQPSLAAEADTVASDAAPDDGDLLNGPSMLGKGNTQDDIDALLASFV